MTLTVSIELLWKVDFLKHDILVRIMLLVYWGGGLSYPSRGPSSKSVRSPVLICHLGIDSRGLLSSRDSQ